jgi:hypothetical protein
VLNFLNDLPDNDELSCTQLSVKCACLLALVTGHRVQTLSLIQISNISQTEPVEIRIPHAIKTSGPGNLQPQNRTYLKIT